MSSSLSRGNVSAQWDVGKAAFSSADRLRQLIGTVAQDNVQPQAVLAAEALGFSLIVSPKRIDEAIVALGGTESTRIADLKVMIGLTSGGVVRTIRNSTALTQFFLVATACKLCYTSEEIGMLMFEMIAASGLLSKYAVASAQLSQLVYSFSGHAEGIVPVDLMHEVAVAITTISPGLCQCLPLDHMVLAELLYKVFGCLQDETVEGVTLSGFPSGVWLTTFFLWLLPEVSSVFVQQQLIMGTENGRLSIQLDYPRSGLSEESPTSWVMQIWRPEGPPTQFVFSDDEASCGGSTSPILLTKSIVDGDIFHNVSLEDTSKSIYVSVIGEFAGAITCFLTEEGRLSTPHVCCNRDPTMSNCAVTSLKNAMSSHWMSQYEKILMNYGWDESIENGQHEALAILRSGLSNRHLVNCTKHEVWVLLSDLCRGYIAKRTKHFDQNRIGHIISDVLGTAVGIAIDAIATATCNFVSGHRRVDLTKLVANSDGNQGVLVALLSSQGLSVYNYRELAFNCLFPDSPSLRNDLVVAVDGLVAGWEMLWHMSTQQTDVLSIRVCVGHIRRDDFAYLSIREARAFGSQDPLDPTEPLILSNQSLLPKRETCPFRLHTVTAADISHLELKSSLVYRLDASGKEASRRVSWSESIANLATACHIDDGHNLNILHLSKVVEKLHDKSLVARWTSILSDDCTKDIQAKRVLNTFRNEKLRFFAAEAEYPILRRQCRTLIVIHSASLPSCIEFAEEKGLPFWTIIC